MINEVIRLRNGDVMVFDENGEEIPWYQGKYEQVRAAILRDAPAQARFFHWFSDSEEPEPVSRDSW